MSIVKIFADAENTHLQKYMEWQHSIKQKVKKFITTLPKGPFIGIHLRNGADWVIIRHLKFDVLCHMCEMYFIFQSRVCDLVGESSQLFSSPQCLGYRNEYGKLTQEMCFPSTSTIIKQIKRAVKKIKATSVFVASDRNHLLSELATSLKQMGVVVTKLDEESPHLDLAILSESNIFIGNCISSFSSFVKRSRDVFAFPTEFWGFPPDMLAKDNNQSSSNSNGFHDEL
jgi:peptide-O-fucosyltransferase